MVQFDNIGSPQICANIEFKKKKCSIYPCSCPNREDRYMAVFHSDSGDLPYFKRFSMNMFTFTKDDEVLHNEVSWN